MRNYEQSKKSSQHRRTSYHGQSRKKLDLVKSAESKMFGFHLAFWKSSKVYKAVTHSFLLTGRRHLSWITGQTPVSKKEGYKHFNNNQQRSNFIGLAILGAIPTSVAAYYFYHLDRAPFTGRTRMIDMSREREYELGNANFRALLTHQVVLPDSHPASAMVRRVGMRIASASGMEQLPWDFRVVDSPIVNAACLPGGKVVVFTGLLELFEYREDALAVVLAHEAAHALARHSAEQLGFAQLLLWAEFAVNLVFHARFITHWLSTFAGRLPYRSGAPRRPRPIIRHSTPDSLCIPRGNTRASPPPPRPSRQLESEADHIGLLLLARTCHYPPSAAPAVLDRLARHAAARGGAVADFCSTHPSDARRVEDVRRWLPEAESERAARCAAAAGFWSRG